MKAFTPECWQDDGWFVGRIKEASGVMSQGDPLEELEVNIRDAYETMAETAPAPPGVSVLTREIQV